MDKSSTRYIFSGGSFPVPTFAPASSQSNSTIWNGLDGLSSGVVIQDGVDYASVGSVGAYSAWHEYFPLAATFDTSFVVHPGDQTLFYAWEGDSSCTYGAGHTGSGCFWFQNQTTGVTFTTVRVSAPNGNFVGASAEAIIERQSGIALAPWFFALMHFAAIDSGGSGHNVNSDPYLNMTLVNGASQTMASATYGFPDQVTFGFIRSN